MSLLIPTTTGEAIIRELRYGEAKTTDLLATLSKQLSVTKQAFYAALRKLKEEEVVVVYGGKAAINTAWLRNMRDLLSQMEQSYMAGETSPSLPDLAQKESVSFTFRNTRHLDAFWGHTQSQIVNRTPVTEPVFSYDPHYWFYIARKETERRLVDEIIETGRQFLMTVGGNNPLDKIIREDFTGDLLQYHMQPLFPKRNYYVVVVGDYVTEVWLDEQMARLLDTLYESTEILNDNVRRNLEKLLVIKARHKIRISRNARKAEILKKKLKKNFFVRSERILSA